MKKIIMAVFAFMNRLFGYNSQQFETVNCNDFESQMQQDGVQLVDVRTAAEYAAGTLEGAINIDYLQPDFASKADEQLDVQRPVYVFCQSGHRSANAARILSKRGFQVVNLEGGFTAWTEAKKPVIQ